MKFSVHNIQVVLPTTRLFSCGIKFSEQTCRSTLPSRKKVSRRKFSWHINWNFPNNAHQNTLHGILVTGRASTQNDDHLQILIRENSKQIFGETLRLLLLKLCSLRRKCQKVGCFHAGTLIKFSSAYLLPESSEALNQIFINLK